VNYGVIVGTVTEDGPAEKAGLRAEDVLIRLNGEPIRNWALFRTTIASTRPGEKVEIEYVRDGKKRTTTITLGEMEPETTAAVEPSARDEFLKNLGLGIQSLTNELRSRLGLDSDVEGVVVSDLDQNSSAYRQGLRQGDVILEVQGESVDSANRFYQRLKELVDGGEEAVLFRVNRQGQRLFIALDLTK
jgi:serine protease Do